MDFVILPASDVRRPRRLPPARSRSVGEQRRSWRPSLVPLAGSACGGLGGYHPLGHDQLVSSAAVGVPRWCRSPAAHKAETAQRTYGFRSGSCRRLPGSGCRRRPPLAATKQKLHSAPMALGQGPVVDFPVRVVVDDLHWRRRSRSSGGYLLDEPPDMTPSFPRTGVSGHAGAVQSISLRGDDGTAPGVDSGWPELSDPAAMMNSCPRLLIWCYLGVRPWASFWRCRSSKSWIGLIVSLATPDLVLPGGTAMGEFLALPFVEVLDWPDRFPGYIWSRSYALVSSSTSTKTTFGACRLLSAQSAETR